MSECIFCQIIHKRAPASVIYEDEQVVSFLSNGPVNPGHALVVPKKHHSNIFEASEKEVAYLFRVTKRVARAVKEAMDVQGIRIVQNNGKDAGQVIFHLHVHVIPMKPHNHFQFDNPIRGSDLLELDAQKIREQLK